MENLISPPSTQILPLFGMAEKSYFDMTSTERLEVHKAALERAKEAAFTRGLPIFYMINGVVIAEYSNGQRFVHEHGTDIAPYHEN